MTLSAIARRALIATLLGNVAVAIWGYAVNRQVDQSHTGVRHSPSYVVPSGYDFLGAHFDGSAMRGRCVAIHYTSDYCEFCRPSSDAWNPLASWLQDRGCGIVQLTPTPQTGVVGRGSPFTAAPLVFVTMDWMSGYVLFGTPTTVVIAPARRSLWFHAGGVAPSKVDDVEKYLDNSGMLRAR